MAAVDKLLVTLLCFMAAEFAFAQQIERNQISYGDKLVIGMLKDRPFNLNPFEVNSTRQRDVLQLIYGYGLSKNSAMIPNPPNMVVRLIPSSDELRWQMLLERNINFHDDTNLLNSDVQFTFEVIRKLGGHILNRGLDMSNIASVSGSGDLEVIFQLREPDEKFGLTVSDIPILSRSYYRELPVEGYDLLSKRHPNGMGPFIFEYQTDDEVQLRYNPHYYLGRPYLEKVIVNFLDDEKALVNALVNGQVDFIEFPDRSSARAVHDLMGTNIFVFLIPRLEQRVFSTLFNINKFPLSEKEVREAIYLSVNRKEIVNRYMKDIGRVAKTLFPQSSPFYERELFQETYNPKKALQILHRAGWRLNEQTHILEKNGQKLSFQLYFARNSEFEANIALAILNDLAELNINVEPTPLAPILRDTLLATNSYEAMLHSYTYDSRFLFEAVDQFYGEVLGARTSPVNYDSPYFNRLLEIEGKKKRPGANLYQRFQAFIAQEKPVLFLFFDERSIIGISSRFEQYRSTFNDGSRVLSRLNPVENWFVPKEKQLR